MKIIRNIIKVFILLVVIFNICFILTTTNSFFGIKTIKYIGNEMAPAINNNNLVLYKVSEQYFPNDIIVSKETNRLYISRIKEINEYSFITKNDLSQYDNRIQSTNDILGKVFFVIDKPTIILYYTCMIVTLLLLFIDIYLALKINKKNPKIS